MSMKSPLILLSLMVLSACASRDPFKPFAFNNTYLCDNNEQIVLSIADQAERAGVSFRGRNFSLEKKDSDLSEDVSVFADSIYALYVNTDENIAVIEKDGIPLFTGCRPSL